ncbi:TasA family protein [Rossellomorea sp. KS-H15a]|uniref:TasA family protein n=1 Tax=Rossellomorea sp. KS-H15a TaxID=2963940 RepID=UPI0020C706C5|nr:TasA family protein [Rossellomorea sp. KS-H15a]UTE77536.1 CalY family protein [Rossellomorea sp. KS-H15a]
MNFKRQLLTGASSIAMGAMAVMGGTFAYFSDTIETEGKFTNGTINIQPEQPYLEAFELTGWKPGDKLVAMVDNQEPAMVVNNQGTLPVDVFLKLNSSSVKGSDNAIFVKQLKFGSDNILDPSWDSSGDGKVSLAELSTALKGDTQLNGKTVSGVGKYIGSLDTKKGYNGEDIAGAQTIKSLKYELEFEDTGVEQNNLQGDVTNLGFTFTGLQYEGTTYDKNNLDNYKKSDGSPASGGGGVYKQTGDINDKSGSAGGQ